MNLITAVTDIAVVILLISVSVTDLEKKIIPDRTNMAIACVGLIQISALVVTDIISHGGKAVLYIADHMFAGILIPGFMLTVNALMKKSFGGGDIKLAGALGLCYGTVFAFKGILLGILLSGIYGIILLIIVKKKAGYRFALGPFIAAGMIWCISGKWQISGFIEKAALQTGGEAMDLYVVGSVALIAVGVIALVWYFIDKKRNKDDNYIDRLH